MTDWLRSWPVYAVGEDGGLLVPVDGEGEPVDVVIGLRGDGSPAWQIRDEIAIYTPRLATVESAVWRAVIAEAMRMGGQP